MTLCDLWKLRLSEGYKYTAKNKNFSTCDDADIYYVYPMIVESETERYSYAYDETANVVWEASINIFPSEKCDRFCLLNCKQTLTIAINTFIWKLLENICKGVQALCVLYDYMDIFWSIHM